MKAILTGIILLMSAVLIGQQSIDLANVYYRTSPYNKLNDGSDQKHLNTIGVDAKLPVVINKSNVFILGLEHQHNSINSLNDVHRNLEFSTNALQLGIEHTWNSKSKLLMLSFTRLNSDFNRIDATHLQQGGLVLGTTKRNETFEWKYGLYYNAEFYGNMFVPLFGFNWKINDALTMKAVLPVSFDLAYKCDSNLIAGLKFEGTNASFRTNQNDNSTPSYIDKADNNLWVYTEFEMAKNIWFHAKLGHSILRNYKMYDNEEVMDWKLGPINMGDNRSTNNSSFKNGLSLEARFIYRLPI